MKKLTIIFLILFITISAYAGDFTISSTVQSNDNSYSIFIDGNYIDLTNFISNYYKRKSMDKKITRALECALYQLLPHSEDFHLVYIPPAERLRQQANRIEQQEKDLELIKQTLQEWKQLIN